jgi:hypothetical protein
MAAQATDAQGFEVEDQRKIPIFIHSELDDLGLTPEAFRVYCHLVRRAGSKGQAFPSMRSMGEKCFPLLQRTKGGKPCGSKPSLPSQRRMVIQALANLEDCQLIRRVNRYKSDGGQTSNVYVLLDKDEWFSPRGIGGCSCHDQGGVIMPRSGGDHTEMHPPDHHTITPRITTRSHKVLHSNSSPSQGSPLEGSPPNSRNSAKAMNSVSSSKEYLDAEIIDFEPVKEQTQPDSAESQIVEVKSSAAQKLISKTPFLNEFYTVYNEFRPALWSRVTKNTRDRERGINRLLQSCDNDKDEALKMLRDSLDYCRQSQWWGTKDLGLDNLLSKDYLISNAERWEVLQSTPGAQRAIEVLADPKRAQFQRDLSIGMDKVREIEARKLAEMAAANGDDF